MIDLTLVVVGKDEAACQQFDRTYVDCDLRLIANLDNESLARIGNRHMETSRSVFGLVHADTAFRAGALESFRVDAMAGKVCGIVGRTESGEYRWCFKDAGFSEGMVRGPGPVSTLDSCSVFFRPDTGLRFDPILFTSYHCHVEDLCMQARARGIPVIVSSADATHLGKATTQAWFAAYQPYRERLAKKWRGHQVMTT